MLMKMDFEQEQLRDLDIKKKVPYNLPVSRLEKSPALLPSLQAISLLIFILKCPTHKVHRSKSIKSPHK